jgi:hypothetical protein
MAAPAVGPFPADGATAWYDYMASLDANARYAPTLEDALPGLVIAVRKSSGAWPARPTARPDIVVHWIGADPDPVIVTSGTGGALDGVDIRVVTQ